MPRSPTAQRASVILVLLIGAGFAMGAACGGTSGQRPIPVTLAQLAGAQGSYQNERICTRGTVEAIQDTSGVTYILADPAQNRVLLQPTNKAAPYTGMQVQATGTFSFSEKVGRVLRLTGIDAAAPTPCSPTPSTTAPS